MTDPGGNTVATDDRDFPEWHGGIPHAYVWGFLLDCPVAAAREALGEVLLPRYERQPHLTVAYAGLAGREFDAARLDADLAALRPLCRGPVELSALSWSSFAAAPMLEISATWPHAAHRALAAGLPWRLLEPYVPHVTVGFYRTEVPLAEPLAALAPVPVPPRGWQPECLQLLRYDTSDIAGPLTVVGELDLTGGDFRSAPGWDGPGERAAAGGRSAT